jgi:hypothetical protein
MLVENDDAAPWDVEDSLRMGRRETWAVFRDLVRCGSFASTDFQLTPKPAA